MTTKLQHSDHIFALAEGSTLQAVSAITGVDMHKGGRIEYSPGARFRLKRSTGDLLWCLDEDGRRVTFSRDVVFAVEEAT